MVENTASKGLGFGIPNVSPALLKQKALNFIKLNGPILPLQIAKSLEVNIIFAGAILSELVSSKLIFATKSTIGSSPLYYMKGQESKLGPALYDHFKQKEKQAYDRLKENNILRDSEAEPWQRIAMHDLKDFCVPLSVTLNGNTEIFWKFHIISDEEAKSIIESLLKPKLPEVKQEIKEPEINEIQKGAVKEIIKEKHKKEDVKQEKLEIKDKKIEKDKFYNIVQDFFYKNNIQVSESTTIRKNREFDVIAKIPSNIGLISYYIKAKNKKTINEVDISLAYSEAQHKKMSCLIITTGKPTKKAITLIEKKFQGIILRQI